MKRVLVISYYWPPSGGVSVLRSLKIVKHLREFGWEPVVYKPSNAYYPYLDQDLLKEVPENLEVLDHPIVEPFHLFKWITGRKKQDSLNNIATIKDKKSSWLDSLGIWIRGNFFIPDARSLWIKPSVRYLSEYLSKHPVEAIFTDGPPHTNTYIGYLLSKKFNIPWLADFQDPWTQVDYYRLMKIGKSAHKKHVKMEQECLQHASKITIASPTWKLDLEKIGAANVDVIYYGFDEDDFKVLPPTNSSDFTIVHIGLLGSDRNPSISLERLGKIKVTKPLKLVLAGQVDENVLAQLGKIKGLEVEYRGMVPRKEALALAMSANILLLPLNQASNAKGRLPGKLYEYLRCYKPILALGPEDSDAASILDATRSGQCFEYNKSQEINNWISETLSDQVDFSPDMKVIKNFSNREQTRKIADYLNEISR